MRTTRLSDIGEEGLLEILSAMLGEENSATGQVVLGIGDDTAVLTTIAAPLISCDALVEGIHFKVDTTSPQALGHKALAVNLSDIAAMGGRPLFYLLTLSAPGHQEISWLKSLFRGFKRQANRAKIDLIGGDLTGSPGPVFINVTILGEAPESGPVLRSGAKAGDALYISGNVGNSALGRLLLERNIHVPKLMQAHLEPRPHLAEGLLAADHASAMIDLSDGLAQDLGRLCRASGCGADIELSELPLTQDYTKHIPAISQDHWSIAVAGGEDYILLATVPEAREEAFNRAARKARQGWKKIGRIRQDRAIHWHLTGGNLYHPPEAFNHYS